MFFELSESTTPFWNQQGDARRMVSIPVDFEIFESLLIFYSFPSLSESMPNITMMPLSGLWEWNADISSMSSLDASFDIGLMNQKMGLVLDANPPLDALAQV